MTQPILFQPNLFPNFSNQNNIGTSLFYIYIDTAKKLKELEKSWTAISYGIEIVDQQLVQHIVRIEPLD